MESCSGSPIIMHPSWGSRSCPITDRSPRPGPTRRCTSGIPQRVGVLNGHGGPIRAIAVHPNGAAVYTASDDKTVRAFDLDSGTSFRTLAGHSAAVRAVAISADGTKIVTGGDDKTVRFWKAADGGSIFSTAPLPAPCSRWHFRRRHGRGGRSGRWLGPDD